MIDVLKDKTIRFIPKDIQPNDPVNRFRCYYIIEELRKKGYNANVYIRHEEKPDIIITLSLDFPKWSNIYEQCLTSDSIVILDLTENEFERSAIVSKKKIANFFTSVRFRPKKILNRLLGFIRRKAFDKDFYGFVASCDAITASSSITVKDAVKYNRNSFFIPDLVDLKIYNQKKRHTPKKRTVIGWTGMPCNLSCLLPVNEVLGELQKKYDIKIILISAWNYNELFMEARKKFIFKYDTLEWSLYSVASQLLELDIAIAPLPHDSYKSFNKVITYWAAGLTVVASPTHEYKKVIDHQKNGFLAASKEEWYEYLENLVLDVELREKQGTEGYRKAYNQFSVPAITNEWEKVLEKLLFNRDRLT